MSCIKFAAARWRSLYIGFPVINREVLGDMVYRVIYLLVIFKC